MMHVSRGCWGREPQVGAADDNWVWGKRSSGQGAPRAQRPAQGSHLDTTGPAVSPAHVAPRGDLKLSVPPAPRPAWRRQPGLTRSSTTGAPTLRNGEFGGTLSALGQEGHGVALLQDPAGSPAQNSCSGIGDKDVTETPRAATLN